MRPESAASQQPLRTNFLQRFLYEQSSESLRGPDNPPCLPVLLVRCQASRSRRSICASPSIGETLTGVNPNQAPQNTYDYGQNAIPRAVQGAREVGSGQYVKGATDILGGVNEGLGSQLLPVGSAPAAVAKGLAGSVAGAAAAPYVVRKLGGSPDAQALAGEVGAALPLAAGVGADLLSRPRPEVLPPVRPRSVDVPEAGNLLTAGEPATIDASPSQPRPSPQPDRKPAQMLGPAGGSRKLVSSQPADITVHRAGKVSGIDEATGLPIVDRSQPSEIPFSARGEDLPPQTGNGRPDVARS